MARARNIKPAFFKNYELADAGMACQLLFEGLWCLADREGRLEDKPRLIKAEIFPYYDVDINGELTVLARLKFIDRYVVNGESIIQVKNFKKHQNPHNTEKASTLPPMPENYVASDCFNYITDNNGCLTVNSPSSNGEYLADSLIPDSLNTDSLIPDNAASPVIEKVLNIPFETFWNAYDKKTDPPAKAKQKWVALKDSERILIMDHIPKYKSAQPDKQYRKSPLNYFKDKFWTLELVKSYGGTEKPRTGNVNAAFGNPQMQPPSQEEIDEVAALQAEFKRRHG